MTNFLEKFNGFRKILLAVSIDFLSQSKTVVRVGATIMENLDNAMVHASSGFSISGVILTKSWRKGRAGANFSKSTRK